MPFYDNALEITVKDVAGENQVVAMQPRSLNGNGHHAGGAAWPA
jgi:hypothetical protein